MIASTGRKIVLVLLGMTVLASASFGGWKLWSQTDAIEHFVQVTPSAQVTAIAPAIAPTDERPTPKTEKPSVKQEAPIHIDVAPNRELPTGKKHARQDELLLEMAQRLHSDAYVKFINQPGMGMRRIEPMLRVVPREWKIPDWTSEEITKEQPPQKGMKDMSLIHRLSLNQFGASNRAEAKSVKQDLPPEKKELIWEIHSLDLVGLVMHDTAKVYVSKRLPEMKELKNTPIRDLDVFESEGLEELVNGKDLYVRSKEGTIRMLGPIRAREACLKCHADTKVGDMLGAFSYTLREARYEHGFRNGNFQPSFPNGGFQGNPLPQQKIQP